MEVIPFGIYFGEELRTDGVDVQCEDLYEFADNWCYTTKWTKADVENKLNRTKRMYGINDSELNKVLAKVNKDFKRG